jgi:hypothetical protein
MEAEMAEQGNSDGTTKRIVRATTASAVSALIAYAIRKAAPMLREKLQSLDGGAVPETLGKAKDAVGEKVGVVTDRIGSGEGPSSKATANTASNDEREKRQRERAQHRQERQKALTT